MACKTAFLAIPVLLVVEAAPGRGEPWDVESISNSVGSTPTACAQVADDRKLCTWHERRSHHLVCEVDAASRRTAKPCQRLADNERMKTFASNPRERGAARPERMRRRLREEARARLEAARSLGEVVALIGAGPIWCSRAETMTCGWHVVRRTPGYITMARAADAPGKKLAVLCRFGADGSAGSSACRAEPAGHAPSPRF